MASGTGITIPPEHTHKLTDICDALEAAGIEHGLWNFQAVFDSNYDGPLELDCDSPNRWDDFVRIVKSFIEPQVFAEGAD